MRYFAVSVVLFLFSSPFAFAIDLFQKQMDCAAHVATIADRADKEGIEIAAQERSMLSSSAVRGVVIRFHSEGMVPLTFQQAVQSLSRSLGVDVLFVHAYEEGEIVVAVKGTPENVIRLAKSEKIQENNLSLHGYIDSRPTVGQSIHQNSEVVSVRTVSQAAQAIEDMLSLGTPEIRLLQSSDFAMVAAVPSDLVAAVAPESFSIPTKTTVWEFARNSDTFIRTAAAGVPVEITNITDTSLDGKGITLIPLNQEGAFDLKTLASAFQTNLIGDYAKLQEYLDVFPAPSSAAAAPASPPEEKTSSDEGKGTTESTSPSNPLPVAEDGDPVLNKDDRVIGILTRFEDEGQERTIPNVTVLGFSSFYSAALRFEGEYRLNDSSRPGFLATRGRRSIPYFGVFEAKFIFKNDLETVLRTYAVMFSLGSVDEIDQEVVEAIEKFKNGEFDLPKAYRLISFNRTVIGQNVALGTPMAFSTAEDISEYGSFFLPGPKSNFDLIRSAGLVEPGNESLVDRDAYSLPEGYQGLDLPDAPSAYALNNNLIASVHPVAGDSDAPLFKFHLHHRDLSVNGISTLFGNRRRLTGNAPGAVIFGDYQPEVGSPPGIVVLDHEFVMSKPKEEILKYYAAACGYSAGQTMPNRIEEIIDAVKGNSPDLRRVHVSSVRPVNLLDSKSPFILSDGRSNTPLTVFLPALAASSVEDIHSVENLAPESGSEEEPTSDEGLQVPAPYSAYVRKHRFEAGGEPNLGGRFYYTGIAAEWRRMSMAMIGREQQLSERSPAIRLAVRRLGQRAEIPYVVIFDYETASNSTAQELLEIIRRFSGVETIEDIPPQIQEKIKEFDNKGEVDRTVTRTILSRTSGEVFLTANLGYRIVAIRDGVQNRKAGLVVPIFPSERRSLLENTVSASASSSADEGDANIGGSPLVLDEPTDEDLIPMAVVRKRDFNARTQLDSSMERTLRSAAQRLSAEDREQLEAFGFMRASAARKVVEFIDSFAPSSREGVAFELLMEMLTMITRVSKGETPEGKDLLAGVKDKLRLEFVIKSDQIILDDVWEIGLDPDNETLVGLRFFEKYVEPETERQLRLARTGLQAAAKAGLGGAMRKSIGRNFFLEPEQVRRVVDWIGGDYSRAKLFVSALASVQRTYDQNPRAFPEPHHFPNLGGFEGWFTIRGNQIVLTYLSDREEEE